MDVVYWSHSELHHYMSAHICKHTKEDDGIGRKTAAFQMKVINIVPMEEQRCCSSQSFVSKHMKGKLNEKRKTWWKWPLWQDCGNKAIKGSGTQTCPGHGQDVEYPCPLPLCQQPHRCPSWAKDKTGVHLKCSFLISFNPQTWSCCSSGASPTGLRKVINTSWLRRSCDQMTSRLQHQEPERIPLVVLDTKERHPPVALRPTTFLLVSVFQH